MASILDFPARGVVTSGDAGKVIFRPVNTNYEMQLAIGQPYNGPVNSIISGIIRVQARKCYTVPSGGGFVAPIFGPPKTIQGRVIFVSEREIVIRAGVAITVALPPADDAIDLDEGPIQMGSMVNVVAMPGAAFESLTKAIPQSATT